MEDCTAANANRQSAFKIRKTATLDRMTNQPYPFAQEFITDASGQVRKVILDINDYEKLIEVFEDEALGRAIAEVRQETPLSLAEALEELTKSATLKN